MAATSSERAEARLALIADVGGTWVRFALARSGADGRPVLHAIRQLAVADHSSLIEAAQHFLRDPEVRGRAPTHAVFAVAGRVEGTVARMTNHPWQIDSIVSAAALSLDHAELINDFTAQALAVPHLAEDERVLLGGLPFDRFPAREASFAVLGPGTGLGVSALLFRQGIPLALSSEGGHAAFAPKTARQRALLEVLIERFPRVSYERILSGAGLSNLHWALSRMAGEEEPRDLRPEEVTGLAASGDARCVEVLGLFSEVFGAFAGDQVLNFGAWDGVYLSGGLVPLLLGELERGAFRASFEDKGRFGEAMTRVPVHAVMHPQAGLLGAAAHALSGASRARCDAVEPGPPAALA